ncbi:hypothetical protein LguiB_012731 [Lonicera macranthoides]
MSPEYAMHGQFSMKSDVFSFGVLVLEIITSKKNSCFYQSEYGEDLLGHAWKLWKDGMSLELMDPTILDAYSRNEVIRCIKMGLLCVQEDVGARPSMATIVLMLSSYTVSVPMPKQPPPFFHSKTESHALKGPESYESTSKSAMYINHYSSRSSEGEVGVRRGTVIRGLGIGFGRVPRSKGGVRTSNSSSEVEELRSTSARMQQEREQEAEEMRRFKAEQQRANEEQQWANEEQQ